MGRSDKNVGEDEIHVCMSDIYICEDDIGRIHIDTYTCMYAGYI